MRCCSAAARSASSPSTPSSSNRRRAFFGPMPGSRVTSTRPGGNFSRSLTADGMSPVSISATIFSCNVLPMPGISVARPSAASAATEREESRITRAALR